MTNVTDKCLVSRKEPSGDKKYIGCSFIYDSISKALFSVITIARRNTDEKHNEINSEIKEWIWSYRSQTKDNLEI